VGIFESSAFLAANSDHHGVAQLGGQRTVIDNREQVERLIGKLRASLPLSAALSPELWIEFVKNYRASNGDQAT
jgi:hypothetical protein